MLGIDKGCLLVSNLEEGRLELIDFVDQTRKKTFPRSAQDIKRLETVSMVSAMCPANSRSSSCQSGVHGNIQATKSD